jgi:hypothetical protein
MSCGGINDAGVHPAAVREGCSSPARLSYERSSWSERYVRWNCVAVLVFAVSSLAHRQAACDSLSEVVLPLLNLADVDYADVSPDPGLDLWREPAGSRVSLRFRDEDVLRKYVDGVRVARLANRSSLLTIGLERLSEGGRRHGLTLQASGGALEYDGRDSDGDWSGGAGTRDRYSRLEYRLEAGRHRAGVGISRSRSSGRDQQVSIERFRSSKTDVRMNRFFWDLLEPTFGREIDFTWRDHRWELDAGWLVALSRRTRFGLAARLQEARPRTEVHYVNDGAMAELRGLRRADVRQKLQNLRLSLAYEHRFRPDWLAWGEAAYTRQRLRATVVQRDVPRSDSGVILDVLELGSGAGTREGVDLKARARWRRSKQSSLVTTVGWGRATYDAEGEGSTPVLGLSLRTLPIAHRADTNLSGTIETWFAGVHWERNWSRMALRAGGLAARSEIEAQTRANAHMAFGLFVAPVSAASEYDVAVYRLFLAPSARLWARICLDYQATQYLANVNRREPEPEPQRQEKIRGGMIHTLTLTYDL